MIDFVRAQAQKKGTRNGRARIYILREGKPVAPDRAFIREARKTVTEVLEMWGLTDGRVYGWRRTAGCRCGCSPGFIADLPFDVFITVNG